MTKERIERIKRDADIVSAFRERGFELKKHGKDYKTLCFLHQDSEPSLIITPGKNLWHCMGCSEGGSVIDFIMKYDRLSFRDALDKLDGNGNQDPITLPSIENSTSETATQKVLDRVVEFYHQTLLNENKARDYLLKRGIYSAEAVSQFKLGYANRTLAAAVPPDSPHRTPLQDIGIFNKKTGHEFFSGSLVVPILDMEGTVTEMYARKISPHLRKGTALHLYLPGPHKGVWNPQAFVASDEIILCEAAIDALTFWVNGFRNVTFSYGTAGFTEDHRTMMREHTIKKVYIAYDNDNAGNKAAAKVAEALSKDGISCYRLRFPPNMDVNEYALSVTPAKKSLAILFKEPHCIGPQRSSLAAGSEKTLHEKPSAADTASSHDTATEIPKDQKRAAKTGTAGGGTIHSDIPVQKNDILCESTGPANSACTVGKNEPASPDKSPSDSQDGNPQQQLTVTKRKKGIYCTIKDREYRIRGLEKNTSYEVLRVSIRVSYNGGFFLDTLDLVQDRPRRYFIQNAAEELDLNREIIKRDLGSIVLLLEEMQEELIEDSNADDDEHYQMSDGERKAAMSYLQSPDLIERVLADLHICGIVNEDTNLLVSYLATVSRMFDDPLGIMFQSSPGSGKSAIMDAVLSFVPEEEKRVYTYMTGQSLFYEGENDLKHKVLAIEEDEGAEKATYSLKTMQSEKRISISSTGTDPQTGRHKSFMTIVNGPLCIIICTTKPFVDEEFMLRFVCLGNDESRSQTDAVLQRQRENETMNGLIRKERARRLKHLHRNIQRLLVPVKVVNPYATRLTFPSNNLRTRRDQMKYLTLIRAIAFLFQYQRPRKTCRIDGLPCEYIEVVPSDIKLAYQIACEVMGRTLDELAPQTRNLLNMLCQMVDDACERLAIGQRDYRFGQKDIREYTGWSAYQVKVHMQRFVELEYVYCYQIRHSRRYEYELVYDGAGENGQKFVPGIAAIEKIFKEAVSGQLSAVSEKNEEAFSSQLSAISHQQGQKNGNSYQPSAVSKE